ncbi:MAG: type II toxin-antitoxin system VapB family antitoxin [Chloroflexi bacterium]|nr:type II toxin-antitoxin system VapB family antitoxin [Chloroflexota bacterium]
MMVKDRTMTRFSVTVDEKLVQESRRLTNSRTKREAIETALKELVQRKRTRSSSQPPAQTLST